MTFVRAVSAVFLPVCCFFVAVAEDVSRAPNSSNTTRPAGTSASPLTSTATTKEHMKSSGMDSSMIQRALYVLTGITIIGILYFLVRALRLKKPIQRKKYGLLSNYSDSVELEGAESDEDNTLYEARSLQR